LLDRTRLEQPLPLKNTPGIIQRKVLVDQEEVRPQDKRRIIV
jgi:hypothetical protein